MKRYLAMLGAALLLLAGGSANATVITLTDTTKFLSDATDAPEDLQSYGGRYVNKLEGFLDHVSWKHQYVFDPAASELLTGTLTLYLKDDEHDNIFKPWTWEFGFGYTENGDWDIGGVDSGAYGYDIDVASLADGMFGVTLKSLGGDFYIKKSVLEITYKSVPEPGTLALLGTGLLAFACSRRRRQSSLAA
ncbi:MULTISPECIES: PEP-CTERM sorting domain-containing protein [Marinobacter]|uniref:PEP-CTERM sorting domain-containing protein n=1 Tax=Marinobacter TaxID=2742 RepID=UPI000DAE6386|nr:MULTISPECIES: PEP-CTERM sorting domain-containing protein [Marinobacter]